jgi:hypothetical protein
VRACALDKLSSLEDVRSILKEEIDRYNNHQVHSTTGEIPAIRFAKAKQQGNSLFRPFVLPKPYTSLKDVFCLRETRMVDGYRRISVFNKRIEVPKVPLREDVEIHLVPDLDRQTFECRIWWNQKMVHSVVYPMQGAVLFELLIQLVVQEFTTNFKGVHFHLSNISQELVRMRYLRMVFIIFGNDKCWAIFKALYRKPRAVVFIPR